MPIWGPAPHVTPATGTDDSLNSVTADDVWYTKTSAAPTLDADQGVLIIASINWSGSNVDTSPFFRIYNSTDSVALTYTYAEKSSSTSTTGERNVVTLTAFESLPGAGANTYQLQYRNPTGSAGTLYIKRGEIVCIPIHEK